MFSAFSPPPSEKRKLEKISLNTMFFIVFALFTTMCVTITGVTQPETAQVNERINITIHVEVNPTENYS